MTSLAILETVMQDLVYALRTMRKSPVLTLTVIMSLALGIGANTAAFSVVRAVLLKPLQYRDPNELVQITADYPRRKIWDTTFSKREFDKLNDEQKSFTSMGSFLSSTEPLTLSGNGEPEALKGARVSAEFLDILGIQPALGRGFLPEEEARGGPDVALLSYPLWRQRFGGDARILGKTIDLNAAPYTVIGVLPQGFTFPMPGIDVWITKPSSWSALPARVWDIVTSQIGFARLKPINEAFARRFWPAYPRGENPLGEHLREGADKTGWLEIVGIVAGVREGGLTVEALPEFYVPWVIHSPQTPYLVLRTDTDPLRSAVSVQKQLEAVDPSEALSDVRTMNTVLESSLGQRRLTMWLVTSFACIAFLLAVLGIYGVVAYSVTQRTQEIGIRRALGAQKSDIFRAVLGQAFVLAVSGAALGVLGALALRGMIKDLLFNVNATDPAAFSFTALLFLTVVMAASFLPARRAANVDPMGALRVG